jgi:glyoxylate/hydroxypyruvate reductase A
MHQIYVELNLNESERERIRDMSDGSVWFARPEHITAADFAAFQNAEIVFGNCKADWLLQTTKLKWLQLASVGVDAYRGFDWEKLGQQFVCSNVSGLFAEPAAETSLAGILALYRGIDLLVPLQAKRDWQKLTVRPQLRILHRARVLILGAGSIAQRLRALLEPFGCQITLFGRTSGDIHSLAEVDQLLPEADIVVGLLPNTPQTTHLFQAERFARMKQGAIFVNAGRGSLVDEAALLDALNSGWLGGAVLDVTAQEPLPAESPLWSAPRTILTQHSGGGSSDEALRVISVFADNLARYQKGQTLLNIVDWQKV